MQFSLPKKKQKQTNKNQSFSMFSGGPSRDSVPFVFFVCFFDFSIWAYFGFVFLICVFLFFLLFFNLSSNKGRCGRVTVVNAKPLLLSLRLRTRHSATTTANRNVSGEMTKRPIEN